MKARILETDNVIKLLLVNGTVKNISFSELIAFLKHYQDESLYEGTQTWEELYEISMDDFSGETLAVVTKEGLLTIYKPELIKRILNYKEIKYITADEYAAKYDKKSCIIRRFCSTGKMQGAVLKGGMWLIPEDAEYPVKARNKK